MSHESSTREARRLQARQLALVIALSAATLLIEVAGGLLSGSLALLSDAGHVLTDLLALVLSLMAVRFASLPATPAKSYGYHRLEILTALLNGALLITISGGILYKAVRRFFDPVPIESSLMLGVAFVGLLANLVGIALLSRAPQNINLRCARMHVVGDALSSVGVLVTGGIIALTGWERLDPLMGGVIALVIAVGSLRIVRVSGAGGRALRSGGGPPHPAWPVSGKEDQPRCAGVATGFRQASAQAAIMTSPQISALWRSFPARNALISCLRVACRSGPLRIGSLSGSASTRSRSRAVWRK